MATFCMPRVDLRERSLSAAELRAALPRGGVDVDAVVPTVRPIVDDVAGMHAQSNRWPVPPHSPSWKVSSRNPELWG